MPSTTPTFVSPAPPPAAWSHLPPPPSPPPARPSVVGTVVAVLALAIAAVPFVLVGGVLLMLALGPTPTC